MFSLLLSATLLARGPFPDVPLHRTKTLAPYSDASELVGRELYVAGEDITRFELPKKEVWRNADPAVGSVNDLKVDGRTLVARRYVYGKEYNPESKQIEGESISEILGMDRATGKLLWTMPCAEETGLVVHAGRMYFSPELGRFAAYDIGTQKPLWNVALDEKETLRAGSVEGEYLVAGMRSKDGGIGTRTFRCFSLTSGQEVWSRAVERAYGDPPVVNSGLCLYESAKDLVAVEVATGKTRWTRYGFTGVSACAAGTGFAVLYEERLYFLEDNRGAKGWDRGFEEDAVYYRDDIVPHGKNFLLGDDLLFDLGGRLVWTAPAKRELGLPVWSDGRTMVVDQGPIIVLEPGDYPPIPTQTAERKALAVQMTKNFEGLEYGEVERLKQLGGEAFDAVLEEYLRVWEVRNTNPEERSRLGAVTDDLEEILGEIASKEDAAKIEAAYEAIDPDSFARHFLGQLFARYADPEKRVLKFIDVLSKMEPEFWYTYSETSVALAAISKSTHPRAIAFMISVLKNPKADFNIRQEAYLNLARTGGEEGLKAVLEERRNAVTKLPPLAVRMKLDSVGPKESKSFNTLIDEFTAPDGRHWGLITNILLGNWNDLFLIEKVNGAWTNPIFTTLMTEAPSRWFNNSGEMPTLGGKSGPDLMGGEWRTFLPSRADLLADSDKDGYSDYAEVRLGTNPSKADTDEDGRPDLEDHCPNVAVRDLTEEEQIMAAALEAHFHFNSRYSPAVMEAEGTKPFDSPGWYGPVIWDTDGAGSQLMKCYENGIILLNCSFAEESRKNLLEGGNGVAAVRLSWATGGLSGAGYSIYVKKIGDEWVVIGQNMTFVS